MSPKLAIAAFVTIGVSAAALSEEPVVPVDGGKVLGSRVDGIESFKGIPFAAPPVGNLRWRAPQPITPWEGVRDATSFGHDCMQIPYPNDAAPLRTQPSEDCLVVNVWRPAAPSRPLPVMVWIHGGGFVNGGSSPAVYDGSAFARQGLAFVSFNYRLGRFGFFAHPALTAAKEGPVGNFGLMDQHAALRWVKRNIARFGGDPDQITIVGESAGGMSVTFLMGLPAAGNLFQQAGIMSGGGRGNGILGGLRHMSRDLPDLPSAETIGANFARRVAIEGSDAEALAALRALPADEVAKGVDLGALFNGPETGPQTSTAPFVDGITLIDAVEDIFEKGAQAPMPVLVGATGADLSSLKAQSKDEVFELFGARATVARRLYDPDDKTELAQLVEKVGGDQYMIEPARFLAGRVRVSGQPAWHYRFSYVASLMRSEWPGAPHASEIPFVFDTLAAKYGSKLTPEDESIAKVANTYFANFVKTGNPNGASLPTWSEYDVSSKPVLDFRMDRGPVDGPDPLRERLDLVEALAESTNH